MKTEINLATVLQRINMLTTPPIAPVIGRGFKRVELTDSQEVIDAVQFKKCPHIAVVSVRKAVNGFGKIGYPKSVFCYPEFAALFA
jgi:hypothetical protein